MNTIASTVVFCETVFRRVRKSVKSRMHDDRARRRGFSSIANFFYDRSTVINSMREWNRSINECHSIYSSLQWRLVVKANENLLYAAAAVVCIYTYSAHAAADESIEAQNEGRDERGEECDVTNNSYLLRRQRH